MSAPIDLYYWPTPNGWKISVALEELGLPYLVHLINIGAGDQHTDDFKALSPNGKMPAIVDPDGPDGTPISIFESGAILQYLARKTGQLYGQTERDRITVDQWLMWQMGSAPYLGGGFGHFYAYAPFAQEYPINRFAMEVKRQLDVLDRHLAGRDWMVGNEITIADIAIAPWYGRLVRGEAYDAGEFLSVHDYKNVVAWAERFYARPAVQRGVKVNRISGSLEGQLHERHSADDFLNRTQDKIGG